MRVSCGEGDGVEGKEEKARQAAEGYLSVRDCGCAVRCGPEI